MQLLLALTTFLLTSFAAALDDFEAKNAATGQVQFKVVDENHIKVLNYHLTRKNPPSELSYLKLSLHGVRVSEVHQTSNSSSAKNETQWTFHLSDNSNATLTIAERGEDQVTEYSLHWPGGQQNTFRRAVCLHTGYNDAHWYQTYQSESPSFPMSFTANVAPFPTAVGFSSPTSTSDVNSLAEYLFLSSDAFAVLLDHSMPLFMAKSSSASTDDPQLCFSVNNTYPYNSANQNASYLDIRMSFFTSSTTRNVTDWVVDRSGLMPKPTKIPSELLFQNPLWKIGSGGHVITEKSVMDFSMGIIKHGFPSKGYLFLNGWNEHNGGNFCNATMDFNRRLFPTPDQMVVNINRLGFSLSLQMDPTFHGNFHHLEGLLVKEVSKQEQQFADQCHSKILDFSNKETQEYLSILLRKFHYEQQLDNTHLNGFSFDHSAAQFFADEVVQNSPQLYTKLYIETVANASQVVLTNVGFRTQHLPAVVQLNPNGGKEGSVGWTSLGRLVANALSVSLGGYSFFSGGVIEAATVTTASGTSVDEELYIRLLQATTFMPVMSISEQPAPWRLSQKTQEIVKKYVDLHSQHSSLIVQLARERLQKGGRPIIRPLWYEFPEDLKAYSIGDQFMLGSSIIVAPVLEKGKRERTVYLPAGQWVDQHGRLYTGAKEIKVAAELEELPCFTKKTTV